MACCMSARTVLAARQCFNALNARTGAELWSFASTGDTLINTPAVGNGVVYLVDIGGTAWALDAKTVAVLWRQPYGSTVGASPTLANGKLYYGSEADNGRDFNRAFQTQFRWGCSILPSTGITSPIV